MEFVIVEIIEIVIVEVIEIVMVEDIFMIFNFLMMLFFQIIQFFINGVNGSLYCYCFLNKLCEIKYYLEEELVQMF